LMRQASMTATEYLDAAIDNIDFRFGPGFSREHPELVVAFVQAAAADFGASIIARAIEGVIDTIDQRDQ
jgi:hypothetical protein